MGVVSHECSSNVWNVKFFLDISANNCSASASIDSMKAIVALVITSDTNSKVPLHKPRVYYVPHKPHSAPNAQRIVRASPTPLYVLRVQRGF
jgi:hypothetical protein